MPTFKKLRVLAIVYDSHVPPERATPAQIENAEWKAEYDVISTLRKMGQEVKVLGVGADLSTIKQALETFRPHVAFSHLEEFHREVLYDQNVVSYLELLPLRYAGCNPRGLMLARDKALTKKLLAFHQIPIPRFAVFPRHRLTTRPKGLSFPLIVKPLTEQGSAGISQSSVVYDDEKLRARVAFIHNSIGADAIVESYIEGRELYVSLLGNHRLEVLPIWELYFNPPAPTIHPIASRSAKWDPQYIRRHGIREGVARGLSGPQIAQIQKIAKQAYRILGLSGYARMDLRLTPSGEVYILEANPNPHIARGEVFAESARKAGISYEALLWRILNLGLHWLPGQLQAA